MAVYLIEEGGKFRLYDEKAGNWDSPVPARDFDDVLEGLDRNLDIKLFLGLERFYIRKTILPALSPAKIKEVLPFEMDGKFLVGSAMLVFDFLVLKELDSGTECLVFAVEREAVKKYLEPLLEKGFNLVSLSPKWGNELEEFSVAEKDFYNAGLNLITNEFKGRKRQRETMTVFKRVYLFALAVMLIFILGLSVKLYFMSKKEKRLKAELASVYSSIFPGQKPPEDLYYGIRSKLTELKQTHKVLSGIDSLEILKNIGEQAKEGLKIKEINIDGDKMTMKGEAVESGLIEGFKNGLKKTYPKAQILETRNQSDGKIGFVVEAGQGE